MIALDAATGTVLAAEHCVLVPDAALTEGEWEELDTMSDSEVSSLAKERGRPVLPDTQALDAVAELLSAADWSSDHLNAVADMIRATGRTIEDIA